VTSALGACNAQAGYDQVDSFGREAMATSEVVTDLIHEIAFVVIHLST